MLKHIEKNLGAATPTYYLWMVPPLHRDGCLAARINRLQQHGKSV
jgi:hypothetical protein